MKPVSENVILIVEDDSAIRTSLAMILEFEGFETRVAENGLDGLHVLETEKTLPSLIILDIMMPIMDGWEFREAQKEHPDAAGVPVVVMTADIHAFEKATKMGAQGFIQKPLNVDHLIKTVSKFAKASH
jgi:CheY-like chemotaxis protein